MEKGFFHPTRGYWQTTNTPPQSVLDSYPEGTISVPLKPGAGYEWVDGEWVAGAPPSPSASMVTAERDRRLNAMAGAYSPSERETWSVQIAEAKALADDDAAPAPLLRALVSDDATALAALATRVLGLADAFAAASGAIMRAHNVLVAMDPIPADYADDKHWP